MTTIAKPKRRKGRKPRLCRHNDYDISSRTVDGVTIIECKCGQRRTAEIGSHWYDPNE